MQKHQAANDKLRMQTYRLPTNNQSNFAAVVKVSARHQRSDGVIYNSNNFTFKVLDKNFQVTCKETTMSNQCTILHVGGNCNLQI